MAAAIRDYCRNYSSAEHHLVYAPRDDAPVEETDIADFASVTRLRTGHVRRVRDLRRYFKSQPAAIVHAHSSFAGAYVRAAIVKSDSRPIIYTPHCYGFERKDSSVSHRFIYWAMEWLLSFNTTAFAACSKREEALSNWPLASARSIHVPNVASQDLEESAELHFQDVVTRVVGAGRLGPQKDPAFFRDCVIDLRKAGFDIDAVWIGGGDPETELMLTNANIELTGWLPRSGVLDQLKAADVYIHSAKWEGFPIAVLEASLIGVPVVARRIAAFDGVDMPVLIDSPADLVEEWRSLISSSFRRNMVKLTAEALADCNDEAQANALGNLYRRR
ncbi:glycosyltransferase [Pseudarthrobacter sp. MEB009]|uniref:glycosyltransferase n=1 Tax=Pseudarthrobacter sp. MEB009 TaxID=3040326 RepID=UPI002552F76C|nr:glycosyltransferase [Pseudarthrobacter sp. MEB009]